MSYANTTAAELTKVAEAVKRPQWETVVAPDCELHFRTGETTDRTQFAGVSLNSMATCCHYFGDDPSGSERTSCQLRDKLAGIVAAIDDVLEEST